VKQSTEKIVLNSLELNIKSVQYTSSDGSTIKPLHCNTSTEDETLTLSFGEPIPVGEGSLEFDFTGELNDKMKGFYRSKYVR
jgi:puromycin-sensitive aminopeptidase